MRIDRRERSADEASQKARDKNAEEQSSKRDKSVEKVQERNQRGGKSQERVRSVERTEESCNRHRDDQCKEKRNSQERRVHVGGKKRKIDDNLEEEGKKREKLGVEGTEQEKGFKDYEDNIELGESSSESEESDSESEEETLESGSSDNLRLRATKILMRGAMPMCPPAQRDWSKIEEMKVEGENGTLTWPPSNWRAMTADQKLMAQEYAALFLEQRGGKFPDLTRRLLLDKYNFLALEGAAHPRPEGKKHKIDSKMRYYNYQYIRNIAKGIIGTDKLSRSILKSIENTDRWSDTDFLTEKLDSLNIKLRV